jgi:hypothetical protein
MMRGVPGYRCNFGAASLRSDATNTIALFRFGILFPSVSCGSLQGLTQ